MAAALWDRGLWVVAGLAISGAAEDALRPIFEPAAQNAWARRPYKVLSPGEAAQLRARETTGGISGIDLGVVDPVDEARRQGVGARRFALQTELARTWPGVAMLLDLRRRNLAFGGSSGIDRETFRESMRRQGYTAATVDNVSDLLAQHLTPQQVALGMVRSIIDDQGLQVGAHDTSGGVVPAYPVSGIDGVAESASFGFDRERLRVMVGEIGLPMSLQEAASAYFRGIIELPDFYKAVAQGDTRPAWGPFILETSRQIPSVADYVQLHLRGHIDAAHMHEGAARHGMSAADADRIYLRSGRPAAPGQMATAAVRGIDGPAGRPMDREQFLLGIAESDIRPEWGPMLWDARYLYPSLFQLTRLVTSGAVPVATGAEWARKARYAPEVVTALTESWGGAQAPTRDPHVVKAENQLWTTLHTSYKNGEADAADAEAGLDLLGVPQGNHARILNLWNHERALVRKQLTPTQLKKAWKGSTVNPATGAPWTRDEALARLEAMGYSPADAETFLDE